MEFRLGGQDYTLSKEDVQDRLKHVAPEDVRKHYVLVEGRRYPVKQALAAAIGRPVTDFITTDAIRIFSNLGFEIGNIKTPKPKIPTTSELLFEEYLKSSGLGYFQFEKEIPGTLRRPDYSLSFKGQEILFEVKEFKATGDEVKNDSKAHAYDPYHLIREKIGAGRKKFKDLENHCCCLVLWNEEKPLVDLGFQKVILGAMLGNVAIQVPFRQAGQDVVVKEPRTVFAAQGGKMVHKEGQQVVVENKTISAILVLENLDIGLRRFNVCVKRWEKRQDREPTLAEYIGLMETARGSESDISLRQLRVVAYDNPFARIPLPGELFRGRFDERYALPEGEDGRVVRVFAGEEIERLEAEEREFAGPSPFEKFLKG